MMKGEALISKCSCNYDWNWKARFHALSLSIKRLTEFHNVETALTQVLDLREVMDLLYLQGSAA